MMNETINSKDILYSNGTNDECYTLMGGGLTYIKVYSTKCSSMVSI